MHFYHWALKERRKRIERVGLVPGNWSRDRLWKPPYVCLAPFPELAWNLSGALDKSPKVWDLWQVWVGEQSGYEELLFDNGNLKEIRVYERIYKRNIWYVGSSGLS